MKSLHLTLMVFCELLFAAFVSYSRLAEASPLQPIENFQQIKVPVEAPAAPVAPIIPVAAPEAPHEALVAPIVSASSVDQLIRDVPAVQEAPAAQVIQAEKLVAKSEAPIEPKVAEEQVVKADEKLEQKQPKQPEALALRAAEPQSPAQDEALTEAGAKPAELIKKSAPETEPQPVQLKSIEPTKSNEFESRTSVVASVLQIKSIPEVSSKAIKVEPEQKVSSFVGQVEKLQPPSVAATVLLSVQAPEPSLVMVSRAEPQPVQQQHANVASSNQAPVVKGGLGPLHLLAATLCSYQPDKQVADETLNQLYNQRAALRKSLFEFMSLKFTSLERFSSKLSSGLEIVPQKSNLGSQLAPTPAPSHGWPVVGKCTAHDLKLMAEAAWCEGPARPGSGRALDEDSGSEQTAMISKLLHVADPAKDGPVVERTIANMNLTQQQLLELQANAVGTHQCRRKALRLAKSLLQHLAEDQSSLSESWPQLYSQLNEDECARKRLVDIMNALSGFRSDATNIRRDNVEFAFAMDDLRSRVLENEVDVPLHLDKQFIELGQFLQQSVKLMMSSIEPARARLTSLRYRSLVSGSDDQCIELHQRLLAKGHPTDCNPTQFGQLPDVLRMTASSLELWSIERELTKRAPNAEQQDQTSSLLVASAGVTKRDTNECVANLVDS